MNESSLSKLIKKYNISESELLDLGLIPKEKKLLTGNVTQEEKNKLKETIANSIELTDASKLIRPVLITVIDDDKIEELIKDVQGDLFESTYRGDRVNEKIPVLIDKEYEEQIRKKCKTKRISVSKLIRYCAIKIIKEGKMYK